MKILNIGSLNLDYVYSVDHMVKAGETLESQNMQVFPGGKGFNQSVALAQAGATVYHAGMIGEDGAVFIELFEKYGIRANYLKVVGEKSGHTIIQVDNNAQNSILLYGGANRRFTTDFIDEVLKDFTKGDWLLLQNEVNLLPYIIEKANDIGLQIALNPSPFDDALRKCDLQKINIFFLNEIEGEQITNKSEPEEILEVMKEHFPHAQVVLTLGKEGVIFADQNEILYQSVFKVNAVDTTAAGDTFTGYFLAGLLDKMEISEILRMSAKASAIAVTKHGAASSIPNKNEVIQTEYYSKDW
ncbi:MAG: ribokinase [Lachnospiraceae bacterium]